eukprot:Skav200729  [mRNA]  locus=scaffold274:51612:55414:+ [translate_table: standard]
MSLLGSWADAAATTQVHEVLAQFGVGRGLWQAVIDAIGDPGEDVRLELNELRRTWLANEEKRMSKLSHSKQENRMGHVDYRYPMMEQPKATIPMDLNVDNMPNATAEQSKKRKREEENEVCLGGMRNPRVAVKRLWRLKQTGSKIRKAWEEFIEENQDALILGYQYGANEAKYDDTLAMQWQLKLHMVLKVPLQDGVKIKDNLVFKSPLNVDLWRAWFKESQDPDYHVAEWADEGVPLGMNLPIPRSNGVFPATGEEWEENFGEAPELELQTETKNYRSFTDFPEDADIEVRRYVEAGFAKVMSWDEVKSQFERGTVSRLALILKEKPEGGVKRRVVVDLLRSGGNGRAATPERIVLPRVLDVTTMAREMAAQAPQGTTAEFVMFDFKDAFCHYPVARQELANCLAPASKDPLQSTSVWIQKCSSVDGEAERCDRENVAVNPT